MSIKPHKKPLPPCPDPELYQLIQTKEGSFWRRKRGTIKQAKLNKAFTENVKAMKMVSPVATHIVNSLYPYIQGLTLGRLSSRICGRLLKHYSKTKEFSFAPLINMDIQMQHTLDKLILTNYDCIIKERHIELCVMPCKEPSIKKQNNLVTEYFFELILIRSDFKTVNKIKSNEVVSKPYSFKAKYFEGCTLSLELPKNNTPFMVLLKISCTEGNEMAAHSKHYAMKIIYTN